MNCDKCEIKTDLIWRVVFKTTKSEYKDVLDYCYSCTQDCMKEFSTKIPKTLVEFEIRKRNITSEVP